MVLSPVLPQRRCLFSFAKWRMTEFAEYLFSWAATGPPSSTVPCTLSDRYADALGNNMCCRGWKPERVSLQSGCPRASKQLRGQFFLNQWLFHMRSPSIPWQLSPKKRPSWRFSVEVERGSSLDLFKHLSMWYQFTPQQALLIASLFKILPICNPSTRSLVIDLNSLLGLL